ncbi:hypothetical protein PLEOSDRAFT_1088335, partial [Pleurotus ostreatus PC15]
MQLWRQVTVLRSVVRPSAGLLNGKSSVPSRLVEGEVAKRRATRGSEGRAQQLALLLTESESRAACGKGWVKVA